MIRLLRRTAAALLVVCAGLFIVGVTVEDDSHAEMTETADEHDESAKAVDVEGSHDESADAAAGEDGRHEDDAEPSTGAESNDESREEERILGVDVESPFAVALAGAVSVALAVGLWVRDERWLALVAGGVAVVFAVFGVVEIAHQIDESRTGLAVLGGVIAAGHTAAAVTAALSTRSAA